MITLEGFRKMAMALEMVVEVPHFEKTSFRIKGKIFATLNSKEYRACVRLSEIDQSTFCSFDASVIYPVPNKWGKYGWTLINLKKIRKSMCEDILNTAYNTVIEIKKKK
jgi:hypothetical protein